MAERRMFAKSIIDSDAFLEMPMSARLLYYDLGMRADDDGFVNSPRKILKMIGASNDDMGVLIMRKFLIPFESGVVVIKHWKIHNYIQNDRYRETNYKNEKKQLSLDENKAYKSIDSACIHSGYNMYTQDSIGKGSIDENSIDKNSIEQSSKEKDSIKKEILLMSPAQQEEGNIPYEEIVEYLNFKIQSHYKNTSKKTRSQIRARWNEGFRLEDFKRVIDLKVKEWTGTVCERYLRPETLFGTKFEWYLNQKERRESKGEVMDTLEAIYNGSIRIK